MGDGFQFLDIILFALIAAFLVLRLRGVLGRRDGFKGRPRDPFAPPADGQADNENVVALPDRGNPDAVEDALDAEPADPLEAGLARLRRSDPSFDVEDFLVGARTAFEMIINAFASGDTDTLRPLLSREVFANFAEEIAKREEAGETLETIVTAIRVSDIVEAKVDGRTARLTIKFVSDQTNLTRDQEGRLIDGDPEATIEVTDFWTFERPLRSRDPNWTLVATGTLD
ncbi:MAG: Tim44/TimA family putative adaptor protein [Rhodospirillales bacterium]|jgi:predicted lipid-binding transport protein (Tim44 family)|nr:Tim44/TimA family putative adaptor protein [Rhodospirillales bacterium]